ncbi:MAG TPA: PhoH family protein [Oligoflexia bacterium]|nr:PhoH family protein [Oligoflexia bacterium]HMP26991.1 PhoH family protein [Oligoflexia bacterium]
MIREKNKKNKKAPRGEPKQLNLAIRDSETHLKITGEQGKNLKILERALNIRIADAGGELSLAGRDSEVDLAHNLLSQLAEIVSNGEQLFPGDLERCLKMLSANKDLRLGDLFRDQIRLAGKKIGIVPKTFNQKSYLDSIQNHDLVFGLGPAGTGKTYLAMAMAVSALTNKEVKRIVLCRPAVEAGEKLGFLPGDMAEKVNPYLRPLYDALHDMVDFERAKEMVEKGLVEVAPLAFMRGRTLTNAFVILDEAQNTTPVQMKMLLTRLGRGAKCVITGDITQIDLPKGTSSGLVEALQILKGIEGVAFVYFSEDDVLRHPLVAKIVAAYKKWE